MEQQAALILCIEKTDSTDKKRTYQLIIPVGSPYGELVDVAFEFMNQAQTMLNQAVQDAQAKKPDQSDLSTPEA